MQQREIDKFLERSAPDDVRATVAWLSASGYTLTSHRGETAFGAQFVYAGPAEVLITVDRLQWMLEVAPRPGAEAWQYDLLIAAQTGKAYGEVFPEAGPRSPGAPLPDQLPEGVSWRETLPGILQWIDREGVGAAVERALHQRDRVMWPRQRKR